ncbi:MAG: DNRLRE domain-containing protein [Pseudomonadales bacterium]|nr:DNRLRE domain-containing protein [Pseudomonadales bacterium]
MLGYPCLRTAMISAVMSSLCWIQPTIANANEKVLMFRDGLNGYNATQDTYIASGKPGENFGNRAVLLADGMDGANDELMTLIQWSIPDIPPDLDVSGVSIKLQIINRSFSSYKILAVTQAWQEPSVTWYDLKFDKNQQIEIATFTPRSKGPIDVTLNAAGVALIRAWIRGDIPNNGIMIRASDTRDGVDFRSSEYSHIDERPMLVITYK